MPTEQEVEAAEAAIRDHLESAFRDWSSAALARAALTAAEGARGQVSDDDANLLDDMDGRLKDDRAKDDEWLAVWPWEVRRLLALARRGSGQAVPDGWVLAPKEPTHEMENAMFGSVGDDDEKMLSCLGDLIDMSPNKTWLAIRAAYRAALAAAPKQAAPDEAAIRADERERCAQNSFMKIKDELAAKAKEELAKEKTRIVMYPPVKAPDFDEICERYKQHAAAPNPEDKH